MTKMIVCDLDETLLRSDKTISPHTETVLQKARAAGIKLVLATGRPKRLGAPYHSQLHSDALICHNGNIILCGEECIAAGPGVPIDDAARILNALLRKYPDKKLSVEISDKIYANFDVSVFWGKTEGDKQMLGTPAIIKEFSDLPGDNADKVLIELASEDEYQEICAALPPDLYAQPADGRKLCVVMHKSTSKLNAIRHMADLWDIPVSQIVAFGDDYNDIDMLRGCGTGVAMANAAAEVKAAADVVTGTNNEDGVAEYIMNRIMSEVDVR